MSQVKKNVLNLPLQHWQQLTCWNRLTFEPFDRFQNFKMLNKSEFNFPAFEPLTPLNSPDISRKNEYKNVKICEKKFFLWNLHLVALSALWPSMCSYIRFIIEKTLIHWFCHSCHEMPLDSTLQFSHYADEQEIKFWPI